MHGPGVDADPAARLPVRSSGSYLCLVRPGGLEEAEEHLRSQGVEVGMGPVARRGAKGGRTGVHFRDPDGSLPELISYADA